MICEVKIHRHLFKNDNRHRSLDKSPDRYMVAMLTWMTLAIPHSFMFLLGMILN